MNEENQIGIIQVIKNIQDVGIAEWQKVKRNKVGMIA